MNWFNNKTNKGNVKGHRLVKEDSRTPLFILYGIDSSGSMSETTHIINESGGSTDIPKIDQANQGIAKSVESMVRFQKENTRFQIKWQVVELNTYCKPIFQTYVNVNDHTLTESQFKAEGSTNIEALFNTYAMFISKKHLGNYNRAVNVILMSDGVPTDIDGWALSEEKWKKIVDKFKAYLDENDFSRNVEFYFIAVGDEAEPFGRYFAGDDHFFKVEDSESIADKLDFVTRQSLADSSTIPMNAIGYSNPVDTDDDDDSSIDIDNDSDNDDSSVDIDDPDNDDDDSDVSEEEDEDESFDEDDSDNVDDDLEDSIDDNDEEDGEDGDGDISLDDIIKF